MFKNYNHLGFSNPYYYNQDDRFILSEKFPEIVEKYTDKKIVDPIAVIEVLNNGYIFGDRTIIQGISKTPWMAKPNALLNKWEFARVSKHGELDLCEEEIADYLFDKICQEVLYYIGTKRKIGILLSGGMDSRIIAGVIDYLTKTGNLADIEVTALTWGNQGSRDVTYAKEIASRLHWKWKHYSITSRDLLNNIYETAIRGCEYSPINLHAIPQIRDDNELDVILAGSYGDSIGRGEYSRKKFRNLTPITRDISNIMGIIENSVFEKYKKYINEEVKEYHDLFSEKCPYMQYELDYQIHYMRKMLNSCMGVINEKIELCQVFTHPDVYNYVFSIKHTRRNDLVYKFVLQKFKTKLDDIPWARTGLPFGQTQGKPDNLLKDSVSYNKLIQNEIFDYVLEQISSKEFKCSGLFDNKSLSRLTKFLKYLPSDILYYYDKLVWLSSIAEMIRIYGVHGIRNNTYHKKTNSQSLLHSFYEYTRNTAKIKLFWLIK